MVCSTVSINFGPAFFWILTILICGLTNFCTWKYVAAKTVRSEHLEIRRRSAALEEAKWMPIDRRPTIKRPNPTATLLKLRNPRTTPSYPANPENFEGWRKLVAAE